MRVTLDWGYLRSQETMHAYSHAWNYSISHLPLETAVKALTIHGAASNLSVNQHIRLYVACIMARLSVGLYFGSNGLVSASKPQKVRTDETQSSRHIPRGSKWNG